VPFTIPTLEQIAKQCFGAFRSNLKGSDAALWPNNVAVAAKVIAGAMYGPYSFLGYISKQISPATAEGVFLTRHATDRGLSRLAPTYAEGTVILAADPTVTIGTGLVLQRADGLQYETLTGGTVGDDGTLEVDVRCTTTGKAGNTQAGVTLSLTSPIERVQTDHTVGDDGIGAGADEENDASLRARILFLMANPPHGGAAHDYVIWAREVNGVTRVFVDPVTATNGRHTVGVWFMMDDSYDDGIPQPSDVTAVDDYIDDLRPAGAVVDIAAPTPVSVDVEISDLSPDTAAVRTAIEAELVELFRREPQVSTDTNPYTLHRSVISEAIAVATGEHNHTLVEPATDVLYITGTIPVLGTVSFT
jgi:uncharacterized phage protein gp47/JayE